MLDTFAYHMPNPGQLERVTELREAYSELLQVVERVSKKGDLGFFGRYTCLARTALEESAMWAIKGIVLEEPREA